MEQVQPVKPVEPVKKIDWGWIRNYLKSLNLSLDEMKRFQLMLEKVPPVVSGKRRRDTVMTQEKRFNLIVIALFHRWKNASIRGLSLSFGLSERTARRFMNNTRVVDNHFYFPLRDIERQTKRVPKKVECVLVSQVPVGMVVSPVPVGTVVSPVQVGMVISPVQVPVVLGRLISVRPPHRPSFCTKRARRTPARRTPDHSVVFKIPLRVGPPPQTTDALSAAKTLLSLCM